MLYYFYKFIIFTNAFSQKTELEKSKVHRFPKCPEGRPTGSKAWKTYRKK
jgi:hypothetical protein